ncbi:hypothetical protein FE257_011722 [Aspergillus nanangensis]|uniref:Uncharacterized protein n=1 Tax=Aspergillus nanangensis TaxID=2582783 RepID=A0AAD4GXU1_ASPNN|nr:hypothetical protein FE257_011722 [Aspergillus nanangensis]
MFTEYEEASFTLDGNWLKKDRKRMEFQNIDPPTSPTRHLDTRYRPAKFGHVRSQPKDASPDRENSTEHSYRKLSHPLSHSRPRIGDAVERHISKSPKSSRSAGQRASQSSLPKAAPDLANLETSLHILSSSSHLPKFEYRRRTHAPFSDMPPAGPPTVAADEEGNKNEKDYQHADDKFLIHKDTSEHDHLEQDLQESATLESGSNTVEDVSSSHFGNIRSNIHPAGTDTMEKFPSAQQVSGNPAISGHLTSLHSIAVTKSKPEGESSTDQDPHFSTQAALVLAQRSFQEDLESQEPDLATSQKQAYLPNYENPGLAHSKNITPFRRLNTPSKNKGTDQSKAPDTAAGQILSTQYIMNAATPFTFSTEKKPIHFWNAPAKEAAAESNLPLVDTGMSTPLPDEAHLRTSKSLVERVPDSMPRLSPDTQSHALETQPSALPMTLTGTTPPTAQDGQGVDWGVDSFDLSQHIADTGSWLQQSLDFTKDLKNAKDPNAGPPSSRETHRSTLGLNITS